VAGILSGRNTNEEAFLFAKLMKKLSPAAALEVLYRERELTEVEKILVSPDRSPNFRGAAEMGVASDGGFEPLMQKLLAGNYGGAYVVGEDLTPANVNGAELRSALGKLSFLVVQDIRLTETAKAAHVVLPSTHFGEKEGTYTNRKGRVQRLNAALVAPDGALQDCEIFIRLLEAAGERAFYSSAEEIFQALSQEIPSYRGLNYDVIGDQGIQLGSGGADPS
jgi:predicted molibdopterin-dependent oxidoreductase YjgC